jgi:hypothetical protein
MWVLRDEVRRFCLPVGSIWVSKPTFASKTRETGQFKKNVGAILQLKSVNCFRARAKGRDEGGGQRKGRDQGGGRDGGDGSA